MRIILPILFSFILFSCGNTEEKSAKQIKMDEIQAEIDTLEKELINIDKQSELVGELKYEVNNIKHLSIHWVKNQSSSDSKEKQELIDSEKKALDLILKIQENKEFTALNTQIENVDRQLMEVLNYVREIKTTLSSFESYEDLSNRFLTEVMVEPGGDFDLTFEKLLFELNNLHIFCQKEKHQVQLKIEKNRISLENLSER